MLDCLKNSVFNLSSQYNCLLLFFLVSLLLSLSPANRFSYHLVPILFFPSFSFSPIVSLLDCPSVVFLFSFLCFSYFLCFLFFRFFVLTFLPLFGHLHVSLLVLLLLIHQVPFHKYLFSDNSKNFEEVLQIQM